MEDETAYDRLMEQQRQNHKRTARGYLQCANKARMRQSEADASTRASGRLWERITGTESSETAAHRQEAAREEATCSREASRLWASRSRVPDGHGEGPTPDALTKNTHRSERYNRLVANLNRDRVNPVLIDRYPWCVDQHLNREEEELAKHATFEGRLWRIFMGGDEPAASSIKHWTDFDVGTCVSNHEWRDHLSGVFPMGHHVRNSRS